MGPRVSTGNEGLNIGPNFGLREQAFINASLQHLLGVAVELNLGLIAMHSVGSQAFDKKAHCCCLTTETKKINVRNLKPTGAWAKSVL